MYNREFRAEHPISIHALLAESDITYQRQINQKSNFYPRSPCGERLIHPLLCNAKPNFYPRSPCGERPTDAVNGCNPDYFYPRSPCGERRGGHISKTRSEYFYPRSPCGERLDGSKSSIEEVSFLSTLSLRRATRSLRQLQSALCHFYPRSPCGERLDYYAI